MELKIINQWIKIPRNLKLIDVWDISVNQLIELYRSFFNFFYLLSSFIVHFEGWRVETQEMCSWVVIYCDHVKVVHFYSLRVGWAFVTLIFFLECLLLYNLILALICLIGWLKFNFFENNFFSRSCLIKMIKLIILKISPKIILFILHKILLFLWKIWTILKTYIKSKITSLKMQRYLQLFMNLHLIIDSIQNILHYWFFIWCLLYRHCQEKFVMQMLLIYIYTLNIANTELFLIIIHYLMFLYCTVLSF